MTDREQRGRGLGQRAIPVEPLGADVVDLGVGRHRGEPAVGLEPQVLAADIVLGKMGVERQIKFDLGRLPDLLTLQFRDRFAHHLDVKVVTDGGYMT